MLGYLVREWMPHASCNYSEIARVTLIMRAHLVQKQNEYYTLAVVHKKGQSVFDGLKLCQISIDFTIFAAAINGNECENNTFTYFLF